MILGYNTNGFADHRLSDALTILIEIGYRSAAITLEPHHLDPPDRRGGERAVQLIKPMLQDTGLRTTIETGSRYILDPWRKHQPTLISAAAADRRRRIEFLEASIDIAAGIGADSVSLWSGSSDDNAGEDALFDRLSTGLEELLSYAQTRDVRLSFEPEPGMLIDTMAKFERLHTSVLHPLLGLTLDVGHVHCLDDGNYAQHVQRWRDVLWNVHIEDMKCGVHQHLMFGDGDMDFASVFDALREIDYAGPVHVELPRHSHNAVETARRAHEFLNCLLS